MPRSKRSKLVTLAQTDKKGRDNKDRIFDEVRTALDTYKYVWVLRLDDVRTPVLQDVRSDWVGSKLLMGKRKVIQKALGETPEEEYKQNLHEIVDVFEGLIGLLFTNEDVNTVSTYFESYKKNDFCRAKEKSSISFTIPAGIIYSTGGQVSESEDVPLPHNLEPTFRNKYKIPTRIKAGKVVIDEPYKVCEKGDILNVTQALILKQFGIASSEFKIQMLAYYDSEKEQVICVGEKKN